MKVGIIHWSFRTLAGAERLCLSLIEKLKEEGHEVWLVSADIPKNDAIKSAFEKEIQIDRTMFFPISFHGLERYKSFPSFPWIRSFLADTDLVVNTHWGYVPVPISGKPYIIYLQNPLALFPKPYDLLQRFYSIPHFIWLKIFRKLQKDIALISNSGFIKKWVTENWHEDSFVVHPPVETRKYLPLFSNEERENLIISIGMFVPRKRHMDQIKILAKALKTTDVKLVIIGRQRETGVLEKMKELAHKLNVSKNLVLEPDAPFEKLLFYLKKGKIFLHTMRDGPFEIAPLEGICAGLIPIVQDSGGPREYVPPEFRFKNLDEAAELVIRYLDDVNYKRSKVQFIEIAKKFDEEVFKNKMMDVIHHVFHHKRIRS